MSQRACSLLLLGLGLLAACAPSPSPSPSGDPAEEPADRPTHEAAEPGSFAIPVADRAPASVLVHVDDVDGSPVEGATVSAGGRSAATDARGDARLDGLYVGDEVVVRMSADGYLTQTRKLTLDTLGAHRVWGMLTPDADNCTDEDACDVVSVADASTEVGEASAGAFDLAIPAGSLVDGLGRVWEGAYEIRMVSFDAHDPGDGTAANSPGPLETPSEDGSGEVDPLESLGMVDVQITTPEGAPLFLDEDGGATATLTLRTDRALADDETLEMWYLDESSASWTRYEAFSLEPTLDGFEAEVPHFCAINYDIRKTRRCAKVSLDLTDAQLQGAELEFVGRGTRMRVPVRDRDIELRGLPLGDVEATLYVYDDEVASESLSPVSVDESGACTDDDQETLSAPADVTVGAGESPGALIRVRSGDCPTEAVTVSIKDLDTEEKTYYTLDGSTLWLEGLREGARYVLSTASGVDGAPVTQAFNAPAAGEEPVLLTLEVDSAFATTPEGGCEDLPCAGDECDSCVSLTVLAGGVPAGEALVQMEQAGRVVTDNDGAVCVDSVGGADLDVVVRVGDASATVHMPRGVSCSDAESCAELTLSLDEVTTCPSNHSSVHWGSLWFGYEDPGFYDEATLEPPLALSSGSTSLSVTVSGLEAEEDAPPVIDRLGGYAWSDENGTLVATGTLEGQPWAWSEMEQADDGALSEGGLHVRHWIQPKVMGKKLGISLDFDMPLSAMEQRRAYRPEELGARTSLWDSYEYPFKSRTSQGDSDFVGTITLEGIVGDSLILSLDEVAFEGARNGNANQRLVISGTIAAPLVSAGNFTRSPDNAFERSLQGALAAVETSEGTDTLRYGPASGDEGSAELTVCMPESDPFMLVGEERSGLLRPFSPLMTQEEGVVSLVVPEDRFVERGKYDPPGMGGAEMAEGVDLPSIEECWRLAGWWDERIAEIQEQVEQATHGLPELTGARTVSRSYTLGGIYLAISGVMTQQTLAITANADAAQLRQVAKRPCDDDATAGFRAGRMKPILVMDDGNNLNGVIYKGASYTIPDVTTDAPDDLLVDTDLSTSPNTTLDWLSPELRWVDRTWAQDLYTSAGQTNPSLDEVATIFGLLPECEGEGCREAMQVELRLAGEQDETALSCAREPEILDSSGGFFAFLGLEPGACATWDRPYELILYADTAREERLAGVELLPVAGGVMILRERD